MVLDLGPQKNQYIQQKHGRSFETAILVVANPLARTRTYPHQHKQRWWTLMVVEKVVLLVLQLWPEAGAGNGRFLKNTNATGLEGIYSDEGDYWPFESAES